MDPVLLRVCLYFMLAYALSWFGIAGTMILEGLGWNGKGISDPINTRGMQSVCCLFICSARKIMGGIPTPPPTRSNRLL